MSILTQIRADAVAARKARDPKASVLVTLIGEVDTRTKTLSPAREMTDDEVVAVVKKFIKNAEETLTALKPGQHDEAIAKAKAEVMALTAYLPQQMSEAEIEAFARQKAAEGSNLGAIMADLKAQFAGKYDGKAASGIVKRAVEEAA